MQIQFFSSVISLFRRFMLAIGMLLFLLLGAYAVQHADDKNVATGTVYPNQHRIVAQSFNN